MTTTHSQELGTFERRRGRFGVARRRVADLLEPPTPCACRARKSRHLRAGRDAKKRFRSELGSITPIREQAKPRAGPRENR